VRQQIFRGRIPETNVKILETTVLKKVTNFFGHVDDVATAEKDSSRQFLAKRTNFTKHKLVCFQLLEVGSVPFGTKIQIIKDTRGGFHLTHDHNHL
jgi:hypothetical protein